ncbi:hypothetical protein ACVINH_005909 [Rhizobium anhuiense]|jgi:hypothetical protein
MGSAIDYGREPVDGGSHTDPISHRQMHAAEELRRVSDLCLALHHFANS